MSNPGQPTIAQGASGDVVRRLQRALRRTPDSSIVVDGIFGPATLAAVRQVQAGAGLVVDGVVGPKTWAALPNGGPMPVLAKGSAGAVVASLQRVLAAGSGQWGVSPGPADGDFGPRTRAAVEAFQRWGHTSVDGVVGDRTWGVSLGAAGATLETAVGLHFAIA